jgi:hypothetical protein
VECGLPYGKYEKYTENDQLWVKGIFKHGKRCGEWMEDGETVTYDPCPPGLEDGNWPSSTPDPPLWLVAKPYLTTVLCSGDGPVLTRRGHK